MTHIIMRARTFRKRSHRGFTLIEILVAIGIIAILASVVIIAINPARQFAQARNSQRASNVTTILNAVGQNIADNKGIFTCGAEAAKVDATKKSIGTGGVNLASCLVPTYLSELVTDPDGGTAAATGYTIAVDAGRYTVCAPKSATETALPGTPETCVTR